MFTVLVIIFLRTCFSSAVLSRSVHRGAFWQFPFRWIYYYSSNKSTGKETGKTHLCAVAGICRGSSLKVYQIRIHFSSVLLNSYLSLGGLMARTPAGDRDQTLPEETNFCIFWTLYFLQFQLCYAHIFSIFKTEGFQFAFPSVFEINKNLQF